MSMFTSKRPEDFDPEPYYCEGTEDRTSQREHGDTPGIGTFAHHHNPRPHFQPTRDPLPYYCKNGEHRADWEVPGNFISHVHDGWRWTPRPEFTTPSNPILVAFRQEVELQREADWLSLSTVAELTLAGQIGFEDATDAECDHATRVLTRLAAR